MRKGAKRKATQKPKSKEEINGEEPNQAAEETQKEPSQSVQEESKQEQNRSAEENGEEPSQPAAAAEENGEEPSQPAAAAVDKPKKKGGKRAAKATTEAVKPPAKRARVVKPAAVTEYFEEKRNLEDLWKEVFPVGTEWDQLDLVYRYKWDFRNLEEAFEEGGDLYGEKVYLFGCTEPQMVFLNGEGKITIIPVVVAVVSPFPPSDKIGINSVQREAEEIVPMKQMKMDWVPYIPLENRDSQVERFKSQIYILGCTQRRAGLKQMKLERVKKFEYCLPYFYHPFQQKEELELQETTVDILFPVEPPVLCVYDWDMDELEEFTDELIKEEALDADQKDAFKEFVKEKVREAKKANREAKEARKKALQEMSEDKKAAFQNMKFLKFYPVQTSETPDISNVKSPFINRYYGKAHKVL